MSTAILPDGSVIVRLASQTVHVDVRTKAIHLRASSTRDELSGSILESFPQAAVDRVRLIRESDTLHLLFLELRSGRALSLGQATSHDMAMMTARVVANVTRCKIEVSQGVHGLPGPSDAFLSGTTISDRLEGSKSGAALDPFEAPTGKLTFSIDEAPTEPPSAKVPVARTIPDGLIGDLLVPPPRALTSAPAFPAKEEDSWTNLEDERDATLEDAFEVLGRYAWDDATSN